jgi:hypothetical protein
VKYLKFNERAPYPILSGYESIQIPLPAETKASKVVLPSLTFDMNFPDSLMLGHGFGVELLCMGDWMTKMNKVIDEIADEGDLGRAIKFAPKTSVSHVIGKQRGVLG